ncbi:MAG TPA: class I SAM-dependent methyltransferase [Actinomycetota bacterium]|nr:class I SAM-dependent methyltransferase [Actinomycetota bacterium]
MGSGFSFETVNAEDYDDLRPDYAPEAVAWVAERAELRPGSLVVDLAAGTGQLSRRFALLGADVLAVEPATNMRATLAERLPSVRVTDGRAESIPLDDGAAEAVVIGNAFHHFDADSAYVEIRRVLRPNGALALFWARPLEGEQWERYPALREIDAAVERSRAANAIAIAIASAYRSWATPPGPGDGYTDAERREFRTTHTVPSARLADLYATSSDVASIAAQERSTVLARVRELAADLPDVLDLPGRSVVDLRFRD